MVIRARSAVLAGILAAGSVLAAPAAVAQQQQSAVPAVQWGACPEGSLNNVPPADKPLFSCATYTVPLDHDKPRKETISLALMRRAASNQAQRIGSLFLNPGGPGGSGWGMPRSGRAIFQPEVLDRFDLVGFDPRGVAQSTPLRCFTTNEEANEVFGRMALVPVTKQQINDTVDAYADYSQYCARNAGDLLKHMTTKDVAQDLDLLRQAVGDKKLTYVGFSYGTLLGATYVNMFPRNSRAIILDGNVDPALRLSNGLQYDRERARGFEIALDAYLKRCDAEGAKCGFSDGNPRAKFDEIRDHLRKEPITLPTGDTVTLDSFTGAVASNLYNPAALKPLADALQGVYNVLHPPVSAQLAQSDLSVFTTINKTGKYDMPADTPYTSDDSYQAVNCTDKPFPRIPALIPLLAHQWERESPTFGRFQIFSDPLGCATWPVKHPDPYRGPWDRKTENPVLVVGNYYDPATQYEFSKRMVQQLDNAVLLSVDSFGHCILGDSLGVDKAAANYLINLETPKPGQVYQPNVQPF
ncbi:alpha/beta hydrolase [Kibdelosporangium persicum]|uniref:Pimeloyl-ACP methyl ester carboxylesterase n=1 Tax=Kibdelosporangium persicum TaxID=2698649 RepID=A0ABX2F0X3_9PSEU|nr:alpha/beta hydrolase [Kibdelosporangium persicum]NRN64932.1 Pimeloyl-ACP methyl ester carboxylesterase [Kibdelosporangium persicum]